ncbi:MAG: hypothetical protein HC795_18930 [Coleofasciculaceae cyanobacterium RL_1_1]|nr:hypothetical protein [Coleofasciculaceae cyanobacterium RL_1_1]
MFDLINPIDTLLTPIDGLSRLNRLVAPDLKAAWQVMTAEKTQRILRAITLAFLVLATIVLVGMVQVARIAWQEAAIAFRAQLDPTGDQCPEAQTVEMIAPKAEAIAGETEVVSSQTSVRTLRKVATQRGIRSAGRMRKLDLLAALNLMEGATALEG